MPRMNILNKREQEKFNTPPIFTGFERKQFFTLPKPLTEIAETLRTPSTRIGFLLACGYFKASKRFFKPDDYHKNDIVFVINILNLRSECFIADYYLQGIRQYHQKVILEFYGYKKFDNQSIKILKIEIASMMQSQLRPKLIFWRCIDILSYNRIQIPTYFMISELILTALNQRKKELSVVIRRELSKETKILLDSLFAKKDEGRYARYKLTLLKKLSQSTKPTQIKERTADLLYIKELYDNIKLLLPVLNLSYESLRYFANSVIKSDIFQLNQRTEEERYLHVVAFIAHQYYRLQDNLVDTLLTSVKYFENAIKRNHKDRCYEHCNTSQQYLKNLVHSIDENVFTFAGKIKNIIENNKATDSKKLNLIQELLNTYQATLPKIKQKWQDLKTGCDVDINVHYYDLMEEHSLRLQNRVSSIIKALEIQGESSAKNLINAIDYFKNTDGIIKNNVPIDFLDSLEYDAIMGPLKDNF